MQDFSFSLSGKSVAEDHAFSLRAAIVHWLPWLEDEPCAGIHAIHGVATHGLIYLSHRTRLVLRLPESRLTQAKLLTGKPLGLEGCELMVGVCTPKPLPRFATLYAHFVHAGPTDETDFCTIIRSELDAHGSNCGILCGKPRSIMADGKALAGYSVMLHNVKLKESVALQQIGLGKHRLLGGGILIPHKSVRAVRAEDDE